MKNEDKLQKEVEEQIKSQNIKRVWFFDWGIGYGWHFFLGKTLGKYTLNINTPWFACGYAWDDVNRHK